MTINTVLKGMLFMTIPFLLGGWTYYVNGRPVYVEDYNNDSYSYDYSDENMSIGSSRPIIINNGTTIIINKPSTTKPTNPSTQNPNYNAGEQKLPNNGINRPGTPYFSGDGSVRDN